MKKYKTTKKHPAYPKNSEVIERLMVRYDIDKWSTDEASLNHWLEKGWIKEVKEKVWYIAKIDNWKLKTLSKGYLTDEYINSIGFKSKKKALNFVLEEANERFKSGYSRPNYSGSGVNPNFKISKYWLETDKISAIFDTKNSLVIWDQENGWIAEPIKEPKLMLGNEAVEIYDNCISYKVESATKEQWMKLVEGIKIIKEYSVFQLPDIGFYWIKYPVTYSKLSNRYSIGCIENITIKQIENITKALENEQ